MDSRITDQLIEDVRKNKAGAFSELIRQTQRFAYGTAYRITRSPEDSKDIVQEAYTRVWKHIGQFNPKSSFINWFASILRNLSIDWIRAHGKQPGRTLLMPEFHDVPGAERQPDTILENTEILELIRAWLPGLPDGQQRVFILRDLENLSIREVQAETGMSEPSVKTNLWLARKKLREFLLSRGYS